MDAKKEKLFWLLVKNTLSKPKVQILSFLNDTDKAVNIVIARSLGMSEALANYHLMGTTEQKKMGLLEMGLVKKSSNPRMTKRYYGITDLGKEVLNKIPLKRAIWK